MPEDGSAALSAPAHNEGVLRRLTLTAALTLVLGGCASYTWYKADTTAESQARDEGACRAEAHAVSFEYAYGNIATPWNVSPWRRPGTGAYVDPSWQAAAEQRAFERCMTSRGYELVRVDKKG
jgi:hypothetical protein